MISKKTDKGQIKGNIFLVTDNQPSFASAQIELLQAIEKCGSITQAAKHIGISYKTAWDRIDTMNNMSRKPLVNRSPGGPQGGGTVLTALGHRIIQGFNSLQDEHQKFIEHLGDKLHSLNDIANFIRSENMKTSARNQFRGTITRITPGAVNVEVELDIGTEQRLVAIITQDSMDRLQLQEGAETVALIKASSVIISTDTGIISSARNKLIGHISRLVKGAVNTDVTLDIGGDKSVSAIITNTSAIELKLLDGLPACALFKAPSVILLNNE